MQDPTLYQINTRTWLTELSRHQGREITLSTLPPSELDQIHALGMDWVWFLSVWETGPLARKQALEHPGLRQEMQAVLPDLRDEDIGGSGFAISGYHAPEWLGGKKGLATLRKQLHARGMKLMLDFIPNHVGLDHPWVFEHPDWLLQGSPDDLQKYPENYIRLGEKIFAHGKDPNFPGWSDTLQINYANPAMQREFVRQLWLLAEQCDGIRCDMAMLLLPDVFQRTWGVSIPDLWGPAIWEVKSRRPDFVFLAEVYWDLEERLQQAGFDFTYDKHLYDRLRDTDGGEVRACLRRSVIYQQHSVRFLENHDERRAAASFNLAPHRAAAVLTYLSPGLKFFQRGQLEGIIHRVPVQLRRAPEENANIAVQHMYQKILTLLSLQVFHEGTMQLLACVEAWGGNGSHQNFVCFARVWRDEKFLVVVNLSDAQSQAYLQLPFDQLAGNVWQLTDLWNDVIFQRDGDALATQGLYLDEPAWAVRVLRCVPQ